MPFFRSPRDLWENLRLSFEVLPLVVCVRVALWRTPFPAFHAAWNAEVEAELCGVRNADAQLDDAQTRRRVWNSAHAVRRAARLVPRASCLTQALVLQRVLARQGQECALFLGVDRRDSSPSKQRKFEAHAWIEWQGRVLIGGDVSRWTPLLLSRPQAPREARE